MESTTAKFDKGKNAVLVENNAQTIYDHLNELEKDSKIYSKRWFWELLQNAKDSVDENSKVSVKVVLLDNELSFSHTGNAFEETDILHLIFHGSSKKSLEGKTGRFGTGFMTTHLLSRKVNIKGKLADNTYFKFDLNREAVDVPQQQENLETSYKSFCESNREETYVNEDFNTVFLYSLSESSTKIAQEGILQLQKILPFVMAFNEKIENIEVNNNNENISISRGRNEVTIIRGAKIITQEVVCNDIVNYVVFIKSESSDVAVLLKKVHDLLVIEDLDESYPKLFFDFPLFGTERFGSPVVINSTKFDLKGERDGIYLGADDQDKPTIVENKKIISDSLNCLNILIEFLISQNTAVIYNLFRLTSSFEYTWLHKEWLENIYVNLIGALLDAKCVKIKEKYLSLNELAIPYSERIESTQYFRLVTDLIRNSTPEFSDVEKWLQVAEGFAKLENKDLNEYDFIIDEKKLCKIIESKKTIDEINKVLITGGVIEEPELGNAINWLNCLFALFSKEQIELYSSHYGIIPNQKNELVKRELNSPFLDRIGDEKIKSVAEKFGWNIKADLMYPGINVKDGVFQSYTLEKAITNISNLSDRITDEQLSETSKRIALIDYLKWLIDNKKTILLKEAYVVVEKGRETSEVNYSKRRLFQGNSDKLLAPAIIWSDKFSLYKDIVLRKFILIDDYSQNLTIENFEYLQSEDLIFLTPLIIKKNPTKNDLKLLVKTPESYLKLLNDKDEIVDNTIEYSDITYLTRTDDNILSKTADSTKSAKILLRFLLSQVLENDIFFNQPSVIIVKDESITLNKCLWVARLKETQWVPIKSADSDKQTNSERPSVANITELIKDEDDILSIIKTKNAALFFNQLGISVADIIRTSLTNEEEKLQWDMTFSQLLTNKNIDPELASDMLSDPNLQEVYKRQKKEREQIKKNQDIGYLFEKIFKEIFESEEYRKQGFSIIRAPIGSDFGLSYSDNTVIKDQDILDENNMETFFKINQILIELKATGKSVAEMTMTQVETATSEKNRKNYVLAVLPLDNYVIDEENVKKYTKFIVNIAEPLTSRLNDFKSYTAKKIETTQEKDHVRLNIEDGNIRYQVKSEMWQNQTSLDFVRFVEWLKNKK